MKANKSSLVFVIDDDISLGKAIAKGLSLTGYECQTFENAEAALEQLSLTEPAAIISDIQLPGIDGMDLVRKVAQDHQHLPIILTTAFGSTDVAIEATQAGAYDFLEKPFKIEVLAELLAKALASYTLSRSSKVDLRQPYTTRRNAIIGDSPAMREICKTIGRVAATDMSVLIGGETGTGKELIAQALFHYSDRSNQPFLSVNCLSIPDNLIESELFGHERGAFTGAHMRRIGRFEQVKNGTLFLDEIGDLPMQTQGKLLRVLQEGVIQRLGSNVDISIQTRVIAATHRNLIEAVHQGEFREDLYYRLSTMEIMVPPLRERPEDILALTKFFLARYSDQFGVDYPPLSRSAVAALNEHPWPGNVRELQNVIQKLLVESRGMPITDETVKKCLSHASAPSTTNDIDSWIEKQLEQVPEQRMRGLADAFEAKVLELSLKKVNGNKKELADYLGLSRPSIYQKLKKHRLFSGKT